MNEIARCFDVSGAGFVLLPKGAKSPPIENSWQTKPHTFDEANRWLRNGGNVGIQLGRALIVLDIDDLSAFEGIQLPDGVVWETRPGRKAILYRAADIEDALRAIGKAPDHAKLPLFQNGEHVADLLLQRSYQLIPPSWKMVDGKRVDYKLISPVDSRPGEISLCALLRMLHEAGITHSRTNHPRKRVPEEVKQHADIAQYVENTRARNLARRMYALRALEDEARVVATSPEGNRHNQLIESAARVGMFVGAGTLEYDLAAAELERAAERAGLSRNEAERTIKDGLEFGMRHPRDLTDIGTKTKTTTPTSTTAAQSRSTDALLPTAPPNEIEEDPCTDKQNAIRMARLFGDVLRYCFVWKKWLVWNGTHWQIDQTGTAMRMAMEVPREIYREAANAVTLEDAKKLGSWAKASCSAHRIEAIERHARYLLHALPDEFDRDIWLLNCQNGTIDLRTGELCAHRRENMITRIVNVEYKPDAPAPTWEAFLNKIFGHDPELIRFVQKALGYSLTGSTQEQCWFLLHGTGQNGKSTFINAILSVVGPYGMFARFESFLTRKNDAGARNDLADMRGRRFVASNEVKQGGHLDEALIKQLTGDDPIRARHLYCEDEEFIPTHKIWMAANHKPTVRETTKAFWRRVRLIPFLVTIPDNEVDKSLGQKLEAEKEGILAWLVRGCLLWQKEGLHPPAKVMEATAEYRDEMDVLAEFLRDICDVTYDLNDKTEARVLYEHYELWCKAQQSAGNEVEQISQRAFGLKLRERGLKKERRRNGIHWCGIRIRGKTEQDDNTEDDDNTCGVNHVNHENHFPRKSPYEICNIENSLENGSHHTQGSRSSDELGPAELQQQYEARAKEYEEHFMTPRSSDKAGPRCACCGRDLTGKLQYNVYDMSFCFDGGCHDPRSNTWTGPGLKPDQVRARNRPRR